MLQNKLTEKPIKNIYFLIGGRNKIEILYYLSLKKMRFLEIKDNIHSITQQLLTKQLREMERDYLIIRKEFNGYPKKVEYSLNSFGKKIIPLINSLYRWEKNNSKMLKKIIKKNNYNSLYDYY